MLADSHTLDAIQDLLRCYGLVLAHESIVLGQEEHAVALLHRRHAAQGFQSMSSRIETVEVETARHK
jgi:hypothetical protein